MHQDLLRLVRRELPDRVVAAHQARERAGFHQLLGRGERGQALLHRRRDDHVLRLRAEVGVGRQVQPVDLLLLQLADHLGGAFGGHLLGGVELERLGDHREAQALGDFAHLVDHHHGVLLGRRVQDADRLERPVGCHRPDLRFRRSHVEDPGHVAARGLQVRHDLRKHGGRDQREHHRDVGDVLGGIVGIVGAHDPERDGGAPGVDQVRPGGANLVDEPGHARGVPVQVPEDDLHRDAPRGEILLEAALDVGHAAEGDRVDAVWADLRLGARVAVGGEREREAGKGEEGA